MPCPFPFPPRPRSGPDPARPARGPDAGGRGRAPAIRAIPPPAPCRDEREGEAVDEEEPGKEGERIAGRGYRTEDQEIIAQAGLASSFSAALVLALYMQSDTISDLYVHPWMIWPLSPIRTKGTSS